MPLSLAATLTVTEDVVALDQNVFEIDPDPEEPPAISGHPFVPLGHHVLHSDSALDRIETQPFPVLFRSASPDGASD